MKTKHGEATKKHGQTRLYGVWKNMRTRCNNKNSPSYVWYGARGIRICKEWDDYSVFAAWARSHGYQEGLQIDRKRNNENYSPSNCRFVTPLVNSNNKRRSPEFKFGTSKRRNKFVAQIRMNGRIVQLGTFDSFKNAKNAYIEAHKLKMDQLEQNRHD